MHGYLNDVCTNRVADVLLGDKDFVGTNPITWTWYPQDITSKYDDSSKVLYPVGYGLKKAQKTGDFTAPADPNVIDLAKTNRSRGVCGCTQ